MRPAKLTGSGRGICALAHYRYQLAQAMSGRGGQGRCAHCGDRGGQSIIGRGTGVGKAIDTKFDPQLVSTGSKVSPFWTQPQPRCRPREDAGERCLPHNERIASKIIAIKFDQVEGIQERAVSMVPVPDEVERCDAVITARDRLSAEKGPRFNSPTRARGIGLPSRPAVAAASAHSRTTAISS